MIQRRCSRGASGAARGSSADLGLNRGTKDNPSETVCRWSQFGVLTLLSPPSASPPEYQSRIARRPRVYDMLRRAMPSSARDKYEPNSRVLREPGQKLLVTSWPTKKLPKQSAPS